MNPVLTVSPPKSKEFQNSEKSPNSPSSNSLAKKSEKRKIQAKKSLKSPPPFSTEIEGPKQNEANLISSSEQIPKAFPHSDQEKSNSISEKNDDFNSIQEYKEEDSLV